MTGCVTTLKPSAAHVSSQYNWSNPRINKLLAGVSTPKLGDINSELRANFGWIMDGMWDCFGWHAGFFGWQAFRTAKKMIGIEANLKLS